MHRCLALIFCGVVGAVQATGAATVTPGAAGPEVGQGTGAPGTYSNLAGFRSIGGRTVFVSPEGTGQGLSAEDGVSLAQAMETLAAGDVVVLAPGRYPPLNWTRSGAPGNPITLRAQNRAFALASNGQRVLAPLSATSAFHGGLVVSASNVVVDGLYIGRDAGSGIEIRGPRSRVVVQHIRFVEQRNTGLLIFGGEGTTEAIEAHDNLFENADRTPEPGSYNGSTARTDYGIRVYGGRNVVIERNIFDGYFHHGISLKSHSPSVTIAYNNFAFCNRWCVELGQDRDTMSPRRDRTTGYALVARNLFNTRPGEGGISAVLGVLNVARADIVQNDFRLGERIVVKHNQEARGTFAHLPALHPQSVSFSGNRFNAATRITLYGRGRTGETVAFDSNTGAATCVRLPFSHQGTVVTSTITSRAAPAVSMRNNPFVCR
jgi:hypothetical protein